MKKLYLLAMLAVILLIMAACATTGEPRPPKMVTVYNIALTKVVNLDDATGRAKPPVADTTLVNKLRYRYDDENLRTIWHASPNGFEVTMYNASDKNIIINWDKGLYLDYDNIGHRLIKSSTKDVDKDKPQAPTTILPRGNLVETLYSADHISLSSLLGVYVRTPLLPTDYATAVRYNGKELKILLPITVDTKVATYEYTFKISSVKQVEAKSSSIFGL